MEGERPKISVIVPVYNVEAYAERCLASLAAQTYPHMEVVMVDDASTDGGGRICDAWAAREEGFHVVHLQENQGVSAARNEGSRRASGAYIAFVDSDDYVEPNLLERLYQALTEGQGDVSVCGEVGLGLRAGPARVLAPAEAARCLARRAAFLWTPWGKLFPAELVKETPFDKRVLCGEDLLFFYQILKRVRRIVYVPDPLYHYVYRAGSLINNGVTEKRCVVLSVLDRVCQDAAGSFPEAEACFQQIALDTAARLAMQTVENGAEGSPRDYLKRFRNDARRHFSWKAWALRPNKKSMAAELALCAGLPVFEGMAAVYRRLKPLWRNRMG